MLILLIINKLKQSCSLICVLVIHLSHAQTKVTLYLSFLSPTKFPSFQLINSMPLQEFYIDFPCSKSKRNYYILIINLVDPSLMIKFNLIKKSFHQVCMQRRKGAFDEIGMNLVCLLFLPITNFFFLSIRAVHEFQ